MASASALVSTASNEPTDDEPRDPPPSPPGATCWICLDDTGPLVRDCSCRGSAGFAHRSCTVEYAERKTRDRCDRVADTPDEDPWRKCPNCRQPYRNELAHDLATERVRFAEENRTDDLDPCLLEALFAKVPIAAATGLANGNGCPERKAECKERER